MQERSWPKCAASAAGWRHSQNNAFDAPDDRFLSAPRGGAITCFFLHLNIFPFCDRRHIQCPIPATWRRTAPDATIIIRCSRNAIGRSRTGGRETLRHLFLGFHTACTGTPKTGEYASSLIRRIRGARFAACPNRVQCSPFVRRLPSASVP